MVEKVRKSLRESKSARWIALAFLAFTMLTGYFIADVMAPLKSLLETRHGWTSTEYGIFTSAYGWFNVFLFMLLIGGIILDKLGIRLTGLGAIIVMIIGTFLKYYALSKPELRGQTVYFLWAPFDLQVFIAALGFAIFGVGVEVAGITVSRGIVKWFKGKEMATAMGLEMATARIGTALALAFSPMIAEHFGDVSASVFVGLLLLIIGFFGFLIYVSMDVRLDKELGADETLLADESEKFRISNIGKILVNPGWILIALLCVLFYSAVFPFLKYAADLMVQKFHIKETVAGLFPSLMPFGTILLTPLFGAVYDRVGKGATIMIIGSFLITLVHAVFAIPALDQSFLAILLIIILGIGFSLVPSAMWPSVPKIIPENQLGTAYAMIFWVQNWGLMGVPALIGWVLDTYCKIGVNPNTNAPIYDYTLPMLIFAGFGVIAIFLAFLLKTIDKKKGYGLELPNIKK